jgi:carboxymethylenebutenolidase
VTRGAQRLRAAAGIFALGGALACGGGSGRAADETGSAGSAADAANEGGAGSSTDAAAAGAAVDTPPAGQAASPRHGEYVMFATAGGDSVRAWVVYPEREDRAPAVIVIHEIFGLTPWIREVTDRYAAEGFVAIAPDLLSGKGEGGRGTAGHPDEDAVVAAMRELTPDEVETRLDGAFRYVAALPAANGRVGTVGFCWGGHQSFQYAVEQPELGAAVVFYGSAPDDLARVGEIRAPVLGLYGGDDARVNAGIPDAEAAMAEAGKRYEKEIFPGAGHGFLRQDEEGANADAAARAWPRSVAFLKAALEAR